MIIMHKIDLLKVCAKKANNVNGHKIGLFNQRNGY